MTRTAADSSARLKTASAMSAWSSGRTATSTSTTARSICSRARRAMRRDATASSAFRRVVIKSSSSNRTSPAVRWPRCPPRRRVCCSTTTWTMTATAGSPPARATPRIRQSSRCKTMRNPARAAPKPAAGPMWTMLSPTARAIPTWISRSTSALRRRDRFPWATSSSMTTAACFTARMMARACRMCRCNSSARAKIPRWCRPWPPP